MSESAFEKREIQRGSSMKPNVPSAEKPPPALDYAAALLTAPQLSAMAVPKRPALLGKWMHEADLGFIFAARGVGKTWMAMLICNALVEGTSLGEWEAGESPRRVLYVDGEMSLADSQERIAAIGITAPGFVWLHHEYLFDTTELTMNIGNAACQDAIAAQLKCGDVLILDNLSALCRGVAENDNDAWEALLPWLLALRRRKVTVIIVHHAGRNGEMRGASRREDAANWILRLQDDTQNDDEREKAIVSTFAKARGCKPQEAAPLRWVFQVGVGKLTYTCNPHSGPDALAALILAGVDSATECAELLGVKTGTVSKWAKRLKKEGRIRIEGRKYLPATSSAAADESE